MHITHDTLNDALLQLGEIDQAELGRRLHALLDLDRTHHSRPDGYPTSTPGAEPSSTVAPPRNLSEAPPGDRTEAAAWAHGAWRDQIHKQLYDAAVHFIEAANHLRGAYIVATRPVPALPLAKPGKTAPVNNDRQCWIMATIGHHEPAYRVTDFEGALANGVRLADGPRPVGRWAYDFVRRSGRLPSDIEKRAHAQGRNVNVPA